MTGHERGLTLIELLVVVLIISATTGIVTLNLPPPSGDAVRAARRMAVQITYAVDEAITGGRIIAMDPEPDGYRFYRYENGGWRDVHDRALAPVTFPEDVVVEFVFADTSMRNETAGTLERDEETQTDVPFPEMVFSPLGETVPVDIRFTGRNSVVELGVDHAGVLEGPFETRL